MWYAASEIIFFLVLAAVIGGLVGYGTAQIYQLDFAALRSSRADDRSTSAALVAANEEIAELRRRLQITTEALRGEDAPTAQLAPPIIAPTASVDEDGGNGFFPPSPEDEHDEYDQYDDDVVVTGRRLSERVADADTA